MYNVLLLKRGDLISYEMAGKIRKGVIVANDKCVTHSSVFQVCPISLHETSNSCKINEWEYINVDREFLLDRRNVLQKRGYLRQHQIEDLDRKLKLQHGIGNYEKNNNRFKRGAVFTAQLPTVKDSSIQSGFRPVIIVTANELIGDFVQVVACTTKTKNPLPTHFGLSMSKNSTVLCETEMRIPISALRDRLGTLTEVGLKKLDECIKIQNGLV